MTKRSYKRPASLLAVSLASLVAWTSAVAEETTEPAPADNSAALKSMGYAMASQLRLNIGFSEEELGMIFEGMSMAAQGESEPEGFKENIAQAQQIYMSRMQVFQEEERQRALEVAEGNKEEAEAFFASLAEQDNIQKTESGLYYEVIAEGEGETPGDNDKVTVNYTGVLVDGRQFESGEGAELMVNRMVPGFSEGLKLMKKGSTIKMYIPSSLGFGDRPSRPGSIIEPGDALIFEVELLDVAKAPRPSKSMPKMPANMPPPPPPPSGPPPGPPPPLPPNLKPPAKPSPKG